MVVLTEGLCHQVNPSKSAWPAHSVSVLSSSCSRSLPLPLSSSGVISSTGILFRPAFLLNDSLAPHISSSSRPLLRSRTPPWDWDPSALSILCLTRSVYSYRGGIDMKLSGCSSYPCADRFAGVSTPVFGYIGAQSCPLNHCLCKVQEGRRYLGGVLSKEGALAR
jgi:hypothetical protein